MVAATASAATPGPIAGYWSVDSTGRVFPDGDAPHVGDLRGVNLNAPVVGIASTPQGKGFWLAAADGGVFTFGDARFYGSAGSMHLNAPVVGIARTPTGRGYWLAAADGGVFTFGDARFLGSAGNLQLNAPVVGIAATPILAQGYRLAASDGGVFTYGNASFEGSAANLPLNAPIVGIASVGLDGYRLAGSDGGVFTYGSASFSGSGIGSGPVSAITTSPFGGYVLQQSTGWWRHVSYGNAASCLAELPVLTQPRFVGIASAFDRSAPSVLESALAALNCPIFLGGNTGSFHGPARWRIAVGVPRDSGCGVRVEPLDRGARLPDLPDQFEHSGSIQMRRTQMAGHSVFTVRTSGPECTAVASSSFFFIQTLPFTTMTSGDTAPFSSANPITIQANGACTTEVRANNDGRLVQRKTGSSYTMNVPAGSYWVSNSRNGTVAVN
jgi:hypothetical protein